MVFLLLPGNLWISRRFMMLLTKNFMNWALGEFKSLIRRFIAPGGMWARVSLFIIIFRVNRLGLLPYVFPPSSHLSFSIRIGFPLWLGFMILRIIAQPNFMLAHLVPLGTPSILIPFMVLIELVRNFIRPVTLSVRLMANITAGHLLLTLLATPVVWGGYLGARVLVIALVLLRVLECAVALIQAYVFRTLRVLYLREVERKSIFKIA